MKTYGAGSITVSKNALKVYGQNTEWLKNDINPEDLLVIDGNIYEIAEVNSSTELTLATAFNQESVSARAYIIIRVAQQVLAADLAQQLFHCITEHNALILTHDAIIKEFRELATMIKKTGIYIDEAGNICQDETPDQSLAGHDFSSNSDTASNDEVQEMLNNVLSN